LTSTWTCYSTIQMCSFLMANQRV